MKWIDIILAAACVFCGTSCCASLMSSKALLGRIQACELAHFGGDAESITGRLAALESRGDNAQFMIDAAFRDVIGPMAQRVVSLEEAETDAQIQQLRGVVHNHEERLRKSERSLQPYHPGPTPKEWDPNPPPDFKPE